MENLDVLKILQTGLPGLVFLLSVLSFRLLSQEQAKDKPNDKVLTSICRFMYINVALAVLTMSSPIIDNFLSEPSVVDKSFETVVKTGNDELERYTAAVCINSEYAEAYMLLLEKESQKLIQVKAKSIIPCSDDELKIHLNKIDMQELAGVTSTADSLVARVSIAPRGFQFPL